MGVEFILEQLTFKKICTCAIKLAIAWGYDCNRLNLKEPTIKNKGSLIIDTTVNPNYRLSCAHR